MQDEKDRMYHRPFLSGRARYLPERLAFRRGFRIVLRLGWCFQHAVQTRRTTRGSVLRCCHMCGDRAAGPREVADKIEAVWPLFRAL